MKRLLLMASLVFGLTIAAHATDRYVSPSGTDSGSTCTNGSPCSPRIAISLSACSDRILAKDGTYQGASYMLLISGKNSCSTSTRIDILAVNDGLAVFDGQSARRPVDLENSSYWIIEGINAHDSSEDVIHLENNSSFNIIRRVMGWNASCTTNSQVFDVYLGSSNNLLEDTGAWGCGRKMYQFYQDANSNTIRRGFAYWAYSTDNCGGMGAGCPMEDFTVAYDSFYNICENCIGTADEKVNPYDRWGILSMDRMNGVNPTPPDVKSNPHYRGSIAYIKTTQTFSSMQNGVAYGGSDIDGLTSSGIDNADSFKDVVIYAPSKSGVSPDNMPVWANGQACDQIAPPCITPNHAPVGNRQLQNVTVITNYTGAVNNCFSGSCGDRNLTDRWVNTNYNRTSSVALAYPGTNTLYNNDGSHGATICNQIVDGVTTSNALWPWPMNARILASSAVSTPGGTTTAINVNSDIQAIFGTFPAGCSSTTGGSTYYAAKTGNDAVSCSAAQNPLTPKLTISGVSGGIACMIASDTLAVSDGEYDEEINDTLASGTSTLPTTIRAINPRGVVLKPTGAGGSVGININGRNYITIDGIDVDATNVQQPYFVGGTSTNITIKNGVARNGQGTFGSGIEFNTAVSASTIQNMEAVNNNPSAPLAHGIFVRNAPNTVSNNTSHGNGGAGIQIEASGATVNANASYLNVSGGIVTVGSSNIEYNNLIYSNSALSSVTGSTNGFYNNDFYNNSGAHCYTIVSGTGNKAQNNICFTNSSDTIQDSGTSSTVSNNLLSDPSWTNAASSDFTLQNGSAAIGAATNLNAVFTVDYVNNTRGGTWDIGAYKFNSTSLTPLIESFNYTLTADLNTQNGGQGWDPTSPWSNSGGGTMTIQTGPGGCGSGSAVQSTSTTGNNDYTRMMLARGQGIISWYQRISITNPSGDVGGFLTGGGMGAMSVEFHSDGTIIVFYSGGTQSLGSYTANTCYQVTVELDQVNHPNMFRASVNGGAPTAWLTVISGTFTPLDGFGLEDLATNAHTAYFDEINGSTTSSALGGGLLLLGYGR